MSRMSALMGHCDGYDAIVDALAVSGLAMALRVGKPSSSRGLPWGYSYTRARGTLFGISLQMLCELSGSGGPIGHDRDPHHLAGFSNAQVSSFLHFPLA